ncbi:V-type ATP synthase subunit I [Aestuariibacter salexigens]|uniref:V-type ATP synthase subunit I n=1 Tax=Aestuariibacter salexigens TaxID=226010 RepID=UPI0003F7A314|nr:hypothetical protein [Aestuariibacter salexigens]
MSIVALKKLTLIAKITSKRDVLKGLQTLGVMHINTLAHSDTQHNAGTSRADDSYKALRFLTELKHRRKQVSRDPEFDIARLTTEVLKLKQSLRDTTDKRDFLKQRIRDITPWGDIDFPPHQALAGYRLWFYILPVGKIEALQKVDIPAQIITRTARFAYVTLISKHEPASDVLPVERTHIGSEPLRELQYQLNDVEVELEALSAQRHALTRYIMLFQLHLAQADDQASLQQAMMKTFDDEPLCLIQGWLPARDINRLEALLEQCDCALSIEDTNPDDNPPTLLDQPQALKAGVDLANFYQVPGYRTWDPSKVLLASFCLFFAMILADAGYALVLLVALLAFRRKAQRSEKGRAYYLLGLALCISTLVYGVMVGSYFGLAPPVDTGLARLVFLDLNDFDSMMQVSIAIGVLHILIANVAQFLMLKRFTRRYVPIGWSMLIVAGYVLWQLGQAHSVSTILYMIMALGTLLIVLCSSEQPITSIKSALMRLASGGIALSGVMSAFGDILSYMRLFALGLASASLAVTFNQLASDVYAASPGLGLLGAILILLVGHALNLLLSIISGVVHGLRLNFIEFYKWGLPEEGYPFQRFAKKEIDHD